MSRLLLLGRRLAQPRRVPLWARAASAKAPTPRMRDGTAGAELFRTLAARRDARGIELSVEAPPDPATLAAIERVRHDVYAEELGQYPTTSDGRTT